MTTKTLIITPQGTSREINLLGEKPEIKTNDMFLEYANVKKLEEWQAIEDSLKEYKITRHHTFSDHHTFLHPYTLGYFSPGTIHQCEVNEEDKTAMIL